MIRALTSEELAEITGVEQDAGFGALDTEKGCLPLRSLDVDVRIDGLSAATTVRQQFVNVFAEPLEATYIFPLPPRAAVVGFRMLVDGAEIRGRIDERAKAREDYDAAVSQGRHAAIVEEERPDVFTLRVGNIPPRSTARVEFTLVAPVTIDSLEATYRFPLVVAPRYCPGEMLDGDQVGDGIAFDTDLVPDASRITPPILLPGMTSPVRLGITVHVAASAVAGKDRSSPGEFGSSLPAREASDERGDRTITVVPDQRLDRDFILRWKVGDETVAVTTAQVEPDAVRSAGLGSRAAVADAPGDGSFAVTIVPPADAVAASSPRDVVFLLDRSGSMEGWQITAARRAVARMVDSLTDQDRVAVIAFDDRLEHVGKSLELVSATDRNRWRVLEWLAGIEARGGTELGKAIVEGFRLVGGRSGKAGRGSDDGRDQCVVLVTDAQVGHEDRVLRDLASNLGRTRMFVVGIDTAVNEGLISRLADASGGLVELVESEERLDEVMERVQARISTPLVADLRIMGDGIEVIADSIVPTRIPELVAGLPLVIRGRYRSASPAGVVRLEGRLASGEPWVTTAGFSPEATTGLGSLWARGRLRHLEDLRITRDERVSDDLEARIVALSTSFGVLCRFTALVAIDDRRPDERILSRQPRRIVQPVNASVRMLSSKSIVACRSMSEDAFRGHGFFCCDDGSDEVVDALARERLEAKRLIAKAKPRSVALADVKPVTVEALLRGVFRLLTRLRRKQAPAELIERLVAAHARLSALPAERPALVALLDALAEFVEEQGAPGDRRRWWTVAGG